MITIISHPKDQNMYMSEDTANKNDVLNKNNTTSTYQPFV